MFKLVVLFALLAVAFARPGGLVYSAPAVLSTAVLPSAVSSSYRTDIHGNAVLDTYAAPVVLATPVVQKAVATAPVAVPAAVSSSYRTDIFQPAVAAPVVQKAVVTPIAFPAAVSSSYRTDVIESKPIVTAVTYGAYAPAVKAW